MRGDVFLFPYQTFVSCKSSLTELLELNNPRLETEKLIFCSPRLSVYSISYAQKVYKEGTHSCHCQSVNILAIWISYSSKEKRHFAIRAVDKCCLHSEKFCFTKRTRMASQYVFFWKIYRETKNFKNTQSFPKEHFMNKEQFLWSVYIIWLLFPFCIFDHICYFLSSLIVLVRCFLSILRTLIERRYINSTLNKE